MLSLAVVLAISISQSTVANNYRDFPKYRDPRLYYFYHGLAQQELGETDNGESSAFAPGIDESPAISAADASERTSGADMTSSARGIGRTSLPGTAFSARGISRTSGPGMANMAYRDGGEPDIGEMNYGKASRADTGSPMWSVELSVKDMVILALCVMNVVALIAVMCSCSKVGRGQTQERKYQMVSVVGDSEMEEV